MKRTSILTAIIILLAVGISFAQDVNNIAIPQVKKFFKTILFSHPYDLSTPPILLPPGSIIDGKNVVRPNGMPIGWECRGGTTKFNTTALAAAQVKGLFQYVNDEHSLTQFYAQCNDAVYIASVNPPSTTGTFGTSMYSLTSGTSPAFGEKINDDMVWAAAGTTPWAFSGATTYPDVVCLNDGSGTTIYTDVSDRLRNNRTDTYSTIVDYSSGVSKWTYFGYRRPLEGISLDLVSGSTNVLAASLYLQTVRAGIWTTVSSITDGLADSSGVTPFYQAAGRISWTYDATDQPYLLPGTQNHLYWYRLGTSKATDNVKAYRVRVHDRMTAMNNLSSGYWDLALGALLSTVTGYQNYTPEVTSGNDSNYMSISSGTTVYFGFPIPVHAIRMNIVPGYTNLGTVSNLRSINYWNGTGFTAVSGVTQDGTLSTSMSLAQSGVVQWTGTNTSEQMRPVGGILTPLFWYELGWSAALPDVRIWEVAGIEKPDSYPGFEKYEGVIEANGRAMFWPGRQYRNGVDFAQMGYPHILNGPLRGTTGPIFGPGRVNAACRLSSYELVSTKNPSRLYLLQGKNPGKWDELLISSTVGVLAPHTMMVIEDGIKRMTSTKTVHAGIFLASDGVYLAERVIVKISSPIQKYWESGTTPYIEPSYADRAYGWIDYKAKTANFAVPLNVTSTSTTQTTNNYILSYDYLNDQWYPPHKLSADVGCGADIVGTDNQRMAYVGDYSGSVYRTNTGNTDSGAVIEHWIKTSDMAPAIGDLPDGLTWLTRIHNVRIVSYARSVGDIEVIYYPDGDTSGVTPTGSAPNRVSMVNSGKSYAYGKVKSGGGGLLGLTHSLRFRSGVSSAEAGANMSIHGFTMECDLERQVGGP